MQAPTFDNYAFEGKRVKAVSSESRIAFSDFVRMSVHGRSRATHRKLGVPDWVYNDRLFREVLLAYAERRLRITSPEDAADDERMWAIKEKSIQRANAFVPVLNRMIEQIETKSVDAPPEREVSNFDRQIYILRRGVLAVVASVCYQSYRLGHDSPTVATSLQLTPPGVRQLLARVNRAAKIVSGEIVPGRKVLGRKPYKKTPWAGVANRREYNRK